MLIDNKLTILLIVSVVFNLFVFGIDIVPFIWTKIKKKLDQTEAKTIVEVKDPEEKILKKSLEMAKSDVPIMVWEEHKGFAETIFNSITKRNPSSSFKMYNYPRAFLYYGISEYCIKKDDKKSLEKFKIIFDKLIDNDGNPKFEFDKVDQAPFGLASLNLYKIYSEKKYLSFSNYIFKKLVSMCDKDGTILYRKGLEFQFNDVIGMVVPFLVEYEKTTHTGESLKIAKQQLDFYIKYGVDKETFLPAHGFVIKSKIKVGPVNWGRGIGWCLLGLAKYHQSTGEFEKELTGIFQSLTFLKTSEGFWTQFPGSSDRFDASPTTMFLYSFNLSGLDVYKKADVIKKLGKYISQDGEIRFTSGDTYGLNDYSKTFGSSELSQGMLLLLLSTSA